MEKVNHRHDLALALIYGEADRVKSWRRRVVERHLPILASPTMMIHMEMMYGVETLGAQKNNNKKS